jgi:COMM domain containing 5
MSRAAATAGSSSSSFLNVLPLDDLLKFGATLSNSSGPQVCRDALQVAFTKSINGETYSSTTDSSNNAIISFFIRILRKLVLSGIGDDSDKSSSLIALGLDTAIVTDVMNVIKKGRGELLEAYSTHNPSCAQYITNMRWRIDVTISSSTLNRVMRPSILLELTLNDGSVELFDVPLEEFHILRYSCAKALSAMGAIESHPVLKIQ